MKAGQAMWTKIPVLTVHTARGAVPGHANGCEQHSLEAGHATGCLDMQLDGWIARCADEPVVHGSLDNQAAATETAPEERKRELTRTRAPKSRMEEEEGKSREEGVA